MSSAEAALTTGTKCDLIFYTLVRIYVYCGRVKFHESALSGWTSPSLPIPYSYKRECMGKSLF